MAEHDEHKDVSGTEPEGSSSEEEESRLGSDGGGGGGGGGGKRICAYEEERLSRIAENKARMEALGIPAIASSLLGSSSKRIQGKAKAKPRARADEDEDEDEDYNPADEVGGGANRDDDDFESDDGEDEDNDDVLVPSKRRRSKVKNKSCKSKKKSAAPAIDSLLSDADFVDEDEQLMQAIALSLQDSAVNAAGGEQKGGARALGDTGRRKRAKSFDSRVKMTEDELVLHFFQFDDGNGNVGMRDLKRVAIAHDFTWTDEDLADMIQCFDSDGDGKLNLDDFRKIAGRCNMIQGADC